MQRPRPLPASDEPVTADPAARSPVTLWRVLLRATGPRILAAQLVLALGVRATLGLPTLLDAAVLLGIALYWPLQEWAAHVWLLHFRPREFRVGARAFHLDPLAARVHRWHHLHPAQLHPIFVPWPIILGLVPVHLAAWLLLAPDLPTALTGVCGFTAATLAYEWLHLLAHAPCNARNRWLAAVQRHHRAHHFHDPKRWFAFALPPLDDWLGTGGRPG